MSAINIIGVIIVFIIDLIVKIIWLIIDLIFMCLILSHRVYDNVIVIYIVLIRFVLYLWG